MRRSGRLVALVTVAVIGAAGPSRAGCGLENCPPVEARSGGVLTLEARSWVGRVTGTGAANHTRPRADVQGCFLGAHLRLDPRWRLGVTVPAARIEPDDDARESQTGLGNPVIHAELSPPGTFLSAGMQVEIPLGDDEAGVADDHWAILPYLRLPVRDHGWARASLLAGVRLAVTGRGVLEGGAVVEPAPAGARHGGAHEDGRLALDPHGDDELVLHADADVGVGWGLRLGGFTAWQLVLGDDRPPSAGSVGVDLAIPAGYATLVPWIEWGAPEDDARIDERVGLALHLGGRRDAGPAGPGR